MKKLLVLAILFLGWALDSRHSDGQALEGVMGPAGTTAKARTPPPMSLAEKLGVDLPAYLRPAADAAADQIRSVREWNRLGKRPVRIGFGRMLARPISLRPDPAVSRGDISRDGGTIQTLSSAGALIWGTQVIVAGSYGTRIHLSAVRLPVDSKMWVWGGTQAPIEFGLELLSPEGDLWTPTIFAETVYLELEVPPGALQRDASLSIRDVSETLSPAPGDFAKSASAAQFTCFQDASCTDAGTFPAIDAARKATALLTFMMDGQEYSCTGTLLNDRQQDFQPYLLTANHCMPTQVVASTLQAYWDYRTPSCNGATPDIASLPQSNGSILLTSSDTSDFTLLRLSNVPTHRFFMGWDPRTASVQSGTKLYRVAFPFPDGVSFPLPETHSESTVNVVSATCQGASRPKFLYSDPSFGRDTNGSSGSAEMLSTGQVVGQLTGSCPSISDSCTETYELADGAFSATYPSVAPWLDPSSGGGSCVPSASILCLDAGRFSVTASWINTDQTGGQGTAVPLTDDTGFFWFFSSSNVEVVTKVLNGCAINGNFWVFAGGLTNVGVTLTFTDMSNGRQKSYTNPAGTTFVTVPDTTAFATCP